MTAPTRTTQELRWIVRKEIAREPRFGETVRDVTAWAVRSYIRLDDTGSHITSAPTFFQTLSGAHRYARAECWRRHTAHQKART